MFQQMQRQGLTPDVVTYTAIISAYEKGGQWRLALSGYEQMRERGCRPDAIVFNAIIDALWETGVIWAQRKVRIPPASENPCHTRQMRASPGKSQGACRAVDLLIFESSCAGAVPVPAGGERGPLQAAALGGGVRVAPRGGQPACHDGRRGHAVAVHLAHVPQAGAPSTCLHPHHCMSSTHALTSLEGSVGSLTEALLYTVGVMCL